MQLKSEAYKALSFLFQWDGVPHAVICDNAKEMVLGQINKNLKEAPCHLKQTELFSPWLNAAKRERKELKKVSGRKLIKSGTPRRLCDLCLEFESYKSSYTTHVIYKLDGEVPATTVSRETSDIS